MRWDRSDTGRLIFAALLAAARRSVRCRPSQAVPSWWPWQQPVRLGLDLQGGTHLLYRVQLEQAVDNRLDRVGRDVERELRDGRSARSRSIAGRGLAQIRLANRDRRADVKAILQEQFPTLAVTESAAGDCGRSHARVDAT